MEERLSQARPSRDTLWTDVFYMNQPSAPERPVERWQFFYKDCEIARRRVMPSRSEWECRDPH